MFNKCEYVISTTTRKQSPNKNNLPEFIFLGRSNVGKSTFINALTNRKMLARTSSKPGKTQTINYFIIDDIYYLCDAPGYGYASRSHESRNNYGEYIEDFLTDNKNLKVTFLLVDFFVGPTKDDILMYEYLKYLKLNIVIIATKTDKVGKTKQMHHKKLIFEKLENLNEYTLVLASANEKKGINEVIEIIKNNL